MMKTFVLWVVRAGIVEVDQQPLFFRLAQIIQVANPGNRRSGNCSAQYNEMASDPFDSLCFVQRSAVLNRTRQALRCLREDDGQIAVADRGIFISDHHSEE